MGEGRKRGVRGVVVKEGKGLGMKQMQGSKKSQLVVQRCGAAGEVAPTSSGSEPLPKEPGHLRDWGTEA